MHSPIYLSSVNTTVRLQTDDETFKQKEVAVSDYFPRQSTSVHATGTMKWFIEDDGVITLLRIKDGARTRYVNEWHETGITFLHRLPAMGRERRLLNRQVNMEISERTPFRVIRCVGSSAYDFGFYIVECMEDESFRIRRICAVDASSTPPPPPKKKVKRNYPKFTSDKTPEPVKSSSEGRHLNYLRLIFGDDHVFYEPASFKVLNRPADSGGMIVNYTPDFLLSVNGKHVFIESKSDMTAVDVTAIAKASGIARFNFHVFFMVGPPCALMCWKVQNDMSISPSNMDAIVEIFGVEGLSAVGR